MIDEQGKPLHKLRPNRKKLKHDTFSRTSQQKETQTQLLCVKQLSTNRFM